MQKFKRLIAGVITFITLLAVTPIGAHAEWKSDNQGWWYTEGSSYATGWRLIDGNWYYFDTDGYMARDTTIDGYYLNSYGAWTTDIPTTNTTSYNGNSGTGNYSGGNQYVDSNGQGLIKGSVDHIYHVPGSTYYDRTKNVVQWFKTVEEAEAAGYRAPKR